MTPDPDRALYALITQIRRAFHDLAATSDRLNADLGISASRRALLEYLSVSGPDTAANIARAKNVSRQHIQQIADQCDAAGLTEFATNPAHKRSQLIRLTAQGQSAFDEIRRREGEVLQQLAGLLDAGGVGAATDTLKQLRTALHDIQPSSGARPPTHSKGHLT